MTTYYEILGVSPNASQQQIKNAYRELVKRYHPDRNPNSAEATKQTQLINEAYAILSDPVKRYEYDNLQQLRREPEPAAQQQTYTSVEEEAPPEVPHYECEICGRQDSSLRVTVFLWVVSLLYVTSKRGWGKILCSRCRIKYNLLWNLEVFIAGWWGFPYGPIYTIEALYKNSKGGIQPEENNASLLAVLAYDFYLQGRYNDAFDALQESQRFKPTKEKTEFLNHLRQYVRPKQPQSFQERLFSSHPAFYNAPLLAVLFIASFLLFFSTDFSSPRSPASGSPYVPTVQNQPREVEPVTPDYVKLAPKFGISVEQIEKSGKVCNEAIAKVASHIKSRVPYIGAIHEGNTTIHQYELDRDKLDEQVIHPYTELIFSEMRSTSVLLAMLRIPNSTSLTEDDKAKVKLHGFLNSQYKAIAATYFNCAILEYSIPIVNKYFSDGVLPQFYVSRVYQLGKQSDVAAWLAQSEYGKAYENLISVISSIRSSQSRIAEMKSQLNMLKAQIDDDNSTLESWQRRLNYYESSGMYDEYNKLVVSYNARLSSAKLRIQEHNDLVEEYNQFIRTTNESDIDGAFNDCLDPRILFASYERVDLHSSKRMRSRNQ